MAGMVKGPAIFLAQFAGDGAPFNSFAGICKWAASLGYKGVQIRRGTSGCSTSPGPRPRRIIARMSTGIAKGHGLAITELATHLQGQLVAVNPAYDDAFDAFAPPEVHGKPAERQKWAVEQMMLAAKASQHLGLRRMPPSLARSPGPTLYPWPQRAPD